MTSFTRRTALAVMGGALAAPYVRHGHAQEAVLNLYNWADYIGETTIADFTAETGIAVNYDLYSSAEEMGAKMLAGSTGYDAVVASGVEMPRFNAAGIFEKLDRSKLPGWGNNDPEVLRILGGWDAGNEYGLPYMWGSVGMAYNVDLVEERISGADLQSLDLIFDPENAAQFADCGISILDSPTDVIPMALRYLGMDGDTTNVADYDAVVELFRPIRQYIRTFDNQNYLNAIPNGELCVINSWSGDYATAATRAAEAGLEMNLAYYVPKTGAPAWIDVWAIPADAPNRDNAYTFLEYMLRPEVIAACTNYVYYANGNAASKPFVDPEILADPAIYPDEETLKRMWALAALNEEQDRAIARAWSMIKTGR